MWGITIELKDDDEEYCHDVVVDGGTKRHIDDKAIVEPKKH